MNTIPSNVEMCCAQIVHAADDRYVVSTYFETDDFSSGSCYIEAKMLDDQWVFCQDGIEFTPPQSFIDWHNNGRPEFEFI
jgi:hypothetical protein